MTVIGLILGAAIVALLWTFGAQNGQPVNLTYFGYALNVVPIWAVIVVSALIGFLVGLLVTVPGRVRSAFTHRRLSGHVQEREKTIGQLRERVGELERDLEVARRTPPAVVVQESRESRDVPDGTTTATTTEASAA